MSRIAAELREEQFRLLAENMPFMCWIADATGYVRWFNQRWYEYTGASPAQMLGWGWQSAHDPRVLDAVLERWKASIVTGKPFEMVFPLKNAAGEYRQFLTRILPYHDAQGSIKYWFGNNVNISAQITAEQTLNDLNAELERRVCEEVRSREMAQEQLAQAEKLTALGQLAGGVAHDFNNIIQVIASYASVLGRSSDNPDKVKLLAEKIIEVSQRGASVTRRLLAFARRDKLRFEPVDATDLLKGVHEFLGHMIKSSISIRLDLAEGLPPTLADKSQLETALINLAANAQDAITANGAITLSAAVETISSVDHSARLASGDYIRISVADTGAGMDNATLARAAEPFFTTKGCGKGTGMGLAMARGFAEQSGGALAISSELGHGTKVTLWLPVSKLPILPIGKEPVEASRGSRHLLLVDDDQAVRKALAEQLAGLGYRVTEAENGVSALALLDGGMPVDLIVSDLSMPGLNGIALIQILQHRRPGLPAILLTGYAGEAEALAVNMGTGRPFSLLRKPVTEVELGTEIEALLTAIP